MRNLLRRLLKIRGLPKSSNAAVHIGFDTAQQAPFPDNDHPATHRKRQQQTGQSLG
jgi:hypothetical protein